MREVLLNKGWLRVVVNLDGYFTDIRPQVALNSLLDRLADENASADQRPPLALAIGVFPPDQQDFN